MTEPLIGWHTIYGAHREHSTPYLTRIWIGRLRLHIFHRPDNDPDCHDHPWDFWTFPFMPYVEEVAEDQGDGTFLRTLDIVPAFRLSFRPATHTHRVVGRYTGPTFLVGSHRLTYRPGYDPTRKIVTVVWRGGTKRRWGFLKLRDGRWCWEPWRSYVFNGGKHTACEPKEPGE